MNGKAPTKERRLFPKPRRVSPPQSALPQRWKEPLFPPDVPDKVRRAPQPPPKSWDTLPPPVHTGDILESELDTGAKGDGPPILVPKKSRSYRELLEWISAFVVVLALALGIRTFVAEPIRVEGQSMASTLAPDEYVLVTKYDYLTAEPQRFDIVACRYPGHSKTFVKRIVGLPGDLVAMQGGILYINGAPVQEDYVAPHQAPDFGPSAVPAGHFFVLGDNRGNSQDSRDPSIGALPRDAITGHVQYVVFPFDKIRGTGLT